MSVAFWIAAMLVIGVLTLVSTATYLHRLIARPVFGGDLELVRVVETTPAAPVTQYESPVIDARLGVVARPMST